MIERKDFFQYKMNLHTHTKFCDGKNSPEELIKEALNRKFRVLGFSGHCYTSYDQAYCMTEEETTAYIEEVRNLTNLYQDRIGILCGIEQDLYGDHSADRYDYAIGSVHAFFKACQVPLEVPAGIRKVEDGCYIYVDWEASAMEWAIEHIYQGDSLALAEDYFHAVSRFSEREDCQIIGHFDLLTKFDEKSDKALFDTHHRRYREAAISAIKDLVASDKIFEINTGAMAKGYRSSPYPSLDLLKEIYKAGGKITLSSDCHDAGMLDFGFEEGLLVARQAGFNTLWVMDHRASWMEVSI